MPRTRRASIHGAISLLLQAVLLAGVLGALWDGQWAVAAFTAAVIVLTCVPLFLRAYARVVIPPEVGLLAVGFVFAALFLGETRDFYERFWWWDIALHGSSGFLLGIVGFLLVHVLNEREDLDVHMNPGFVAFFAFLFALGIGALWELFEFGMDQAFGSDMQKAMLGDASGLTDTMWDLLVAAVGGLAIAALGYGYLRTPGHASFLERWIDAFLDANPRLFRRRRW